jgi:hypothetical protein
MESCCQNDRPRQQGVLSGIFYGLIPHTFCIAFVVLSLAGAVGGATLAKEFLMLPYFFLFLTILSLMSATLASFLYFKKNDCCNWRGIKKKYKYLITLYSVTIITNILVAYLIIPALTNGPDRRVEYGANQLTLANIEVQIPCPGHAPLIIDELGKVSGVEDVSFQAPRTFKVAYNSQETSLESIEGAEIFKTFKIRSN